MHEVGFQNCFTVFVGLSIGRYELKAEVVFL